MMKMTTMTALGVALGASLAYSAELARPCPAKAVGHETMKTGVGGQLWLDWLDVGRRHGQAVT